MVPVDAILTHEYVFTHPTFASCHAATIVETDKGSLIAAWFGGSHEGARDVAIWSSRLEKGHWTKPEVIADGVQPDGERHSCYNPVLCQPRGGDLVLFFKVGLSPATWHGAVCLSKDDGKTWTRPERMKDGYLGPIKNQPFFDREGGIFCPSSTETGGFWQVHFEWLSKDGKPYEKTGPVNDGITIGAIQPALLWFPDGHIRAIGRTKQKRLFVVDSTDSWVHWGPMRLIDVPNPNSGIDATTLRDHRHILVYNDSTEHRTPLTVATSTDGEKWTNRIVLENTPGEFSYPYVIQTRDGLVHIVYTWNRTNIRHAVIDPTQLQP